MAVATSARRSAASLLMVVGAIVAAWPSAALAKSVMVFGPHPDDESLIAAGRVRAAVNAGDTVKMVVVTNGDIAGTSSGLLREGESVAAAQLLGLTEQDVIFLGYGDGLMRTLVDSASGSQVYRSNAGQTATYGSRGLGGMDYHHFRFGAAGPYSRDTVVGDVQAVISAYRPDEVYTTSQFDDHPDHQAVGIFVAEALANLQRAGANLPTKLYQTIVWTPWYGGCSDAAWPQVVSGGFSPTQPYYKSACFDVTQLDWERIQRFVVPPEMRTTSTSTNLKYRVINAYASQVTPFLISFARLDEFYWLNDFATNLALTAQVTVSSENTGGGQGRLKAVDGTADGAFHDSNREWVTMNQLGGAWIQLTWPSAVTVAQVNLWDRPLGGENILAGTLSFSSGSPVGVGALPTDGSVQQVMFAPRSVTWVRFTVNQAQGSATGLSEIQVLGPPAGSTADLPPIFNWGPVPAQLSFPASQTTTVTSAANDLDGDSYSYFWSVNGGAIQGTGPTGTFYPPALSASTIFTITSTVQDTRGGSSSNVSFVTVGPGPGVTPPGSGPSLSSVTVSPASVTGGSPSTGTVTLSGTAPSGGVVVALSSSSASAVVPASVTVAAGAGSATFAVTTGAVAVTTTATLTASYAGVNRTASLTLNPAAALSSLAVSPASVAGGSPSTGTVTLTSAAPVGGVVVSLSSSSASAEVPDSATVLSGATSATFAVTTSPVSTTTTATLTASYAGVNRTATLTLTPPATLAALTMSPASVAGGASSTGTVALSGAAPAGGALVALSSDSASAVVPASVTVAAGASSVTFTATTSAVAATTIATLTVSYAGLTQTAGLTVTPATLTSVTLSPTSVTGGASSAGTVTLSGAAPAGGAVVALSSNNAAAAVPASVTVAAGATSATFTATTSVVAAVTTATITATYAGVSRTASLTVNPVVVVSLVQDAGFPTRNVYGWTTGTKSFSFTTPGANRLVVVAISYANYAQAATGHTVSGGGLTWTLARQTLADASSTFVALWSAWVPAAGTYTATFNSGLTRTYDAFLTVHSFSGSSASGIGAVAGTSGASSRPSLGSIATTGTPAYLLAVGYANGAAPTADASSTITAVDTSAGPAFWTERSTSTLSPGTYAIGISAPASPSSWAMAAVEVRAGGPPPPLALTALSVSPASVTGGSPSTGTVTLNGAAPSGGAVVALSSSSASAVAPASVTVAAGASSATFAVTTSTVSATTTATLTATYAGVSQTATLTLTPVPSVTLTSVTLSPASVTGGNPSTGTVTLSGAAPAGGAVVALSDDSASETEPGSVTVAAGATSATFTVTTSAVSTSVTATLTASYAGLTRTASLTVTPAGAGPRTFGYSTLTGFAYAAHNWPLGNAEQVQPATLTEAGTLTALRTYFYTLTNGAGSGTRVRGIIYADAGGAPGALLAVTPQVTNLVAGAWRDLPLTTPIALAPGTYWIGIWGDTSQDALSLDAHNRYKTLTYSATGPAQSPWDQNGDPGTDGLVHRPICGVYTPAN